MQTLPEHLQMYLADQLQWLARDELKARQRWTVYLGPETAGRPVFAIVTDMPELLLMQLGYELAEIYPPGPEDDDEVGLTPDLIEALMDPRTEAGPEDTIIFWPQVQVEQVDPETIRQADEVAGWLAAAAREDAERDR